MDRSRGRLEDYEINFHDEEQDMTQLWRESPFLRPTPIYERTHLTKSNLPQTHTSTDHLILRFSFSQCLTTITSKDLKNGVQHANPTEPREGPPPNLFL